MGSLLPGIEVVRTLIHWVQTAGGHEGFCMLQTIEVEIDRNGRVHPLEPMQRLPEGRALLTLLSPPADETALLAQAALAEDWLKPEEDEAWAHLQPDRS